MKLNGDLNVTGNLLEAGSAVGFIAQQVESVVTTVLTGTTTTPALDDTIPQISEGDQITSRAITPRRIGNIILVQYETYCSGSNVGSSISHSLYEAGSANALVAKCTTSSVGAHMQNVYLSYRYTVTSLSTLTFSIRTGINSGTYTINGSGGARLFGGSDRTSLLLTELNLG